MSCWCRALKPTRCRCDKIKGQHNVSVRYLGGRSERQPQCRTSSPPNAPTPISWSTSRRHSGGSIAEIDEARWRQVGP